METTLARHFLTEFEDFTGDMGATDESAAKIPLRLATALTATLTAALATALVAGIGSNRFKAERTLNQRSTLRSITTRLVGYSVLLKV